MRPERAAGSNRDEVVGVYQTVDGGQVAAFQGEIPQPFHRRLFLARIDADFSEDLLKECCFWGQADGCRVDEPCFNYIDLATDFSTQCWVGCNDTHVAEHDGTGPQA